MRSLNFRTNIYFEHDLNHVTHLVKFVWIFSVSQHTPPKVKLSAEHSSISSSSWLCEWCLACAVSQIFIQRSKVQQLDLCSRGYWRVCKELSAHRVHVKAHLYNGGTGFGDSFHVAHNVWMYLSCELRGSKHDSGQIVPAWAAQNQFLARRKGDRLPDWDPHTPRGKPSWKTAALGFESIAAGEQTVQLRSERCSAASGRERWLAQK